MTMKAQVKMMNELKSFKIPKGQILWETRWNKDGELLHFVTSNADRTKYFKYVLSENGTAEKISAASSPKEL